MADIVKLPKKCPGCKREVNSLNKLVEVVSGLPRCLICVEEMTHKEIMDYLTGKTGPVFMCSNIGQQNGQCEIYVPERDYKVLYPIVTVEEWEKIHTTGNPPPGLNIGPGYGSAKFFLGGEIMDGNIPRNPEKDLEICEKATSGPWAIKGITGDTSTWTLMGNDASFAGLKLIKMTVDDVVFIASAREALPYYIKRCMELEEQIKDFKMVLSKAMVYAYKNSEDPT